MIYLCVFDHRPRALALRSVDANPNDPTLLAAICRPCNERKTARDLRIIARARRARPGHAILLNTAEEQHRQRKHRNDGAVEASKN